MSGYSANTPGAFIDMYSLQNCSMRCPINSSKVALQARATLDVPEAAQTHQVKQYLVAKMCQQQRKLHSLLSTFTDDVGKDEVPTGDEGPDFPHGHVGVKIR